MQFVALLVLYFLGGCLKKNVCVQFTKVEGCDGLVIGMNSVIYCVMPTVSHAISKWILFLMGHLSDLLNYLTFMSRILRGSSSVITPLFTQQISIWCTLPDLLIDLLMFPIIFPALAYHIAHDLAWHVEFLVPETICVLISLNYCLKAL